MTPTSPAQRTPVPVVGLTGRLGAGKTTLLNHVLRRPRSRVGVVVNDFGPVDVDAGLIAGQVDDVAAITGGCVCCLPDTGALDDALSTLTAPRLRLDAIVVEASGVADPVAFSHTLRFSGAERIRFGGVVEVVDGPELLHDGGVSGFDRFGAASLVVVNKLDRVPSRERSELLRAVAATAAVSPTSPIVVGTRHGRIDPALLFDIDTAHTASDDELDFSPLFPTASHESHSHATSVWVDAPDPVDPAALLDLLESPPTHAYRMKGRLRLRTARNVRSYVVNVVHRSVHIAPDRTIAPRPGLVAIGEGLDEQEAGLRMATALRPTVSTSPAAMRRLRHRLRASA